jgi:hypothetical protein
MVPPCGERRHRAGCAPDHHRATGVAGLGVALVDAAEQKHLVVHGQPEQHREQHQRLDIGVAAQRQRHQDRVAVGGDRQLLGPHGGRGRRIHHAGGQGGLPQPLDHWLEGRILGGQRPGADHHHLAGRRTAPSRPASSWSARLESVGAVTSAVLVGASPSKAATSTTETTTTSTHPPNTRHGRLAHARATRPVTIHPQPRPARFMADHDRLGTAGPVDDGVLVPQQHADPPGPASARTPRPAR